MVSDTSEVDLYQQLALRDTDVLARFKTMPQTEPLAATTKLAMHLTKERRELGSHTNDLEDKMDVAAMVLEKHEQDITDLKKELAAALLRLEDFENRARKGNLHLRGIPETVVDLNSTALFRLTDWSFDRIHWELGPKKPEGPPWDIVIKFTYYRTKESLL